MQSKEDKGDMKVREIMSRPIITEDEDASVMEVAMDMAKLGIGSVVITSEGKPAGIITERDIALKVLLENKRANEVKAKEIMSSPLVTIEPEASIGEASALAARKRIKRLPVVENGVLVGIVSVRNLLTLKPEYVKRFYPEVRLLASGWTLDRLERVLSESEVCLAGYHVLSYKKRLKEVYDELEELVSYYVDDEELKDIYGSIEQLYQEVEGKGEGEKEISVEEQRRKLNKILRKFRHMTYLRKQQSISSFTGDLWLGSYRYHKGKEPRLPFKRTRP
ncbi:MAG: CBS domain-containing protein [archaeon]|nr:CBS domain-containing protein [archaeon]